MVKQMKWFRHTQLLSELFYNYLLEFVPILDMPEMQLIELRQLGLAA